METILESLRSHVDVLWQASRSDGGKKLTGTKTKRLKAVTAINELLAKKSVVTALSASSKLEMIKGPPENVSSEQVPLGWAELVSFLLVGVDNACTDAKGSKSVSKCGVATLKPEFMVCLRSAITKAMRYGPSGVIRHATPVYLAFSHDWLREPALRVIIADQTWQLVRDMLQDDENRAMLTPTFIRTWVDTCFEQVTGRGPLHHKSSVVTSIASDVLQLLAKPVPSYDILTQSTRGVSTSKMLGGDYSYSIMCERCCLMMVLAKSLPRREARELQVTSFRTLTQLLKDHAVNVLHSTALNSIINVALQPILSCWTDRKYHDPAVSLMRVLVFLAPNNAKLHDVLRRRFLADTNDQSSSALLRAGFDVKDDLVETAAACFSLDECLKFVANSTSQKGHLILWLRVTYTILSCRVLKKGISVLVSEVDLKDQVRKTILIMTGALRERFIIGHNQCAEALRWIAKIVSSVCSLTQKLNPSSRNHPMYHSAEWKNIYQELLAHATRVKSDFRFRAGYMRGNREECWFDVIVQSLCNLYSMDFFEPFHSPFSVSAAGGSGNTQYPLSRILRKEERVSFHEVRYFRNIIAKSGAPTDEGSHLRHQLLDWFVEACELQNLHSDYPSERILDASCAILGLSRGECVIKRDIGDEECMEIVKERNELNALFYLQRFYCMSLDEEGISGHGTQRTKELLQQLRMWKDEPPRIPAPSCHLRILERASKESRIAKSIEHVKTQTRHFAVDLATAESLERALLEKVKQSLTAPARSAEYQDGDTPKEAPPLFPEDEIVRNSPSCGSESDGFVNIPETVRGIKSIILLGNYILYGLRFGSVLPVKTETNREMSTWDEIIATVSVLLRRLSRTNADLFVADSTLTETMVTVMVSLMRHIQSESNPKSSSCTHSGLVELAQSIFDTMLTCSQTLSEYVVSLMEMRTKKIVQRIEFCSSSTCPVEQFQLSFKKRRRNEQCRTSKKKRRVVGNPEPQLRTLRHDRFSDEDESDHLVRKGQQPSIDNDSVSSDNSDEFLHNFQSQDPILGIPEDEVNDGISSDSWSIIPSATNVLQTILLLVKEAGPAIFRIYENGYDSIKNVGSSLNPDGHERSSLLSDLVDEGFLTVRECLWSTFFAIGTYASLILAGEDILSFGGLWRDAESVSRRYIALYSESFEVQKRKQYPLPYKLEGARVAFLEYARVFMLRCSDQAISNRLRQQLNSSDGALPMLITGILEIADHFRSAHAFRMPRVARASYLSFGVSTMEVISECYGALLDTRHFGPKLSSLCKLLHSTRTAVLKLLSDPNGSVRVLAAHYLPRLLKFLHFSRIADMEVFAKLYLPDASSCVDCPKYYNTEMSSDVVETTSRVGRQWDLDVNESNAEGNIHESFIRIGSTSRGLTLIQSLVRTALFQESLVAMVYVDVFQRVVQNPRLLIAAYYGLVRVSAHRLYESPKRLFDAFSRIILHKWLRCNEPVTALRTFPVALVLDKRHHEEGIRFDWMREYQNILLPFILVQESVEHLPQLGLASSFAEDLGVDLSSLLVGNVSSFSLVYPMHFTENMHHRAQRLWNAIDAQVEGKSMKLMHQRKVDVIQSLLRSICTNVNKKKDLHHRMFNFETGLGFLRDTKGMAPPLYDPLVIALSINQLYRPNPQLFIIGEVALDGSIFGEVRDEKTGDVIADSFTDFLKECRRKNYNMLHILITIQRFLVGVPRRQPAQNRLDGFFCLGVLWRMASTNILIKSTTERKLFYRLIARGFENPETVADAAWLLFDVLSKLVKLYEVNPNLSIPHEHNLMVEADIAQFPPHALSSREQALYELLSTVSPIMVNVLVMAESDISKIHQDIAYNSLRRLLSECQKLRLWRVILANGPMPAHHNFRHLEKIYWAARRASESDSGVQPVDKSLAMISRFHGMYRLRGLHTSPAVLLGYLQELNATLSDAAMRELSQLVRNEAWIRSNGSEHVTGIEVAHVLSCVVDLVHRIHRSEVINGCVLYGEKNVSSSPTLSISSLDRDLRNAILQESAGLLTKLGLLNLRTSSVASMRTDYRDVPPRAENGKYEDVSSGIEMSIFLLQGLLDSSTPVVVQNAFDTLKDILQSKEGRHIFGLHRERLQAISILRDGDRGQSILTKPGCTSFVVDPQRGDLIPFQDLPDVTDPELWSSKRNDFGTSQGLDIWIRTFCSVFAKSCRSKAMQSLSQVCFSSYQASCSLIPYIFMDTICDFDTQHLSLISRLLKEHVLKNRIAPNVLRRMFVHTLDVLCQIGLDVVFKDGITLWFQKTDKTYTFPCYYVFEIPYDEAASVALNCGAYFSVLRFAQLYINQEEILMEFSHSSKHNRKQISPEIEDHRERRLGVARERIEPLVREAMNRISEPDGKTAFISNENLATFSATAAIYNQNWAAALEALDAVQHQHIVPDEVMSTNGSVSRLNQTGLEDIHHADLNRELQKFQCFLRIGALTIASDYWEALHRRLASTDFKNSGESQQEDINIVQQLNELRYAAAWKLQHWESPKALSVKDPSATSMLTRKVGFHEALYHVLHSFTTERYMDACETILLARNSLLLQMVEDTTAISATRIFRTAAELSILEFLSTQNPGTEVSSSIAENPFLKLEESDRNGTRINEHLTAGKHTVLQAPEGASYDNSSRYLGCVSDTEVLLQLLDTEIPNDQVHVMPLINSVDSCILAEEVPAVLFHCLNKKSDTALAAAASSARLLAKGGDGCWARAASCLGTPQTSLLDETTSTKKVAWKLQYSRLMWYSGHDARSRRKALDIVKNIITKELGGKLEEIRSNEGNESETVYQYINWLPGLSSDELLQLLRVEACCLAAKWSLDMRTREPMELFRMYLEPGLSAAQLSSENQKLCARAHLAMASFANEQIKNIDVYRNSRTYEEMVQALQDMESKVERMREMREERLSTKKSFKLSRNSRTTRSQMTSGTVSNKKLSRELDGLILYEQKKARMDRARLEKLSSTYRKWQLFACKHFAACLRAGTNQDLRAAFRLVAIWLDSGSMREPITAALARQGTKDTKNKGIDVPASKLLPLAPQLASRLNYSENVGQNIFQPALMNTIITMASQFPAHCLWQILALTNSTRSCATEEKYTAFYRGDKDKRDAAEDILDRLVHAHGATVSQMKTVAEAYIAVSEIDPEQKDKPYLNLRRYALVKLGEMKHVPIPTFPLPICANDYWDSLPHIHSFQEDARVCAGLSKPLSIVCIGSDGKTYPQLVKGRDDLRGDAVMEQMFMIVNQLLQRDTQAAERNLLIRTYRIIPLSPFSGIMQFVDNTEQLKDVLVEPTCKKGSRESRRSLHERYRPKDLKHNIVLKSSFKEYGHPTRRDVVKLRKYLKLAWPKFQPVFRHFFIEQWPDPCQWFQHQLNYSRSVAVMSIVGFILGLGDRHLSNILMDVRTAEVVHIDFGIAFEQGKLLATPEKMPFRLTRDIVDGFGVAGVEGVFRRCCEITLRVMRHNKDVLLTVIDVLLHDPMFTWALTPEEVLKEQGPPHGDSDDLFEENETSKSFPDSALDAIVRKVDRKVNGSRDAQRALYRISEKLGGLEGTERLSVGAHVARLIDEARAFHVLSVVFPGWSPWV